MFYMSLYAKNHFSNKFPIIIFRSGTLEIHICIAHARMKMVIVFAGHDQFNRQHCNSLLLRTVGLRWLEQPQLCHRGDHQPKVMIGMVGMDNED